MHLDSIAIAAPDVQKATPHRKPAPPLQRNEYGAISPQVTLNDVCRAQLRDILALAVKSGHLNATYIRQDRREMECLNHDVYDVLLERGRIRAVVIQERTFWKHLRKTRSRVTKRYVMLTLERRSLRAEELDTATCAKRAKNTSALGELVRHYAGIKPVRCITPRVIVETTYKVLARAADGTLRSVFDGSEYRMGVWRSEAAAPDHGGGFYFFWSEQDAVAGTETNTTFAAGLTDGLELVLCEVEVAGRTVEYAHGKHAASRLRLRRELRVLRRSAPEAS